MERLHLYRAVHKAQRAHLFALAVEAGRTDSDDLVGASALAAAVSATVDELRAHAQHEETFIHPLLQQKAPAIAATLDAGHRVLDARLDEISEAVRAGDMRDLYASLTTFTAAYLEHLACEENEAMPALWASCSDEELLGVIGAFRASRSPVENLTSILAQLPTLSPSEAVTMVSLTLGDIPPAEIGEILGALLPPRQLGALYRSLTPRAMPGPASPVCA